MRLARLQDTEWEYASAVDIGTLHFVVTFFSDQAGASNSMSINPAIQRPEVSSAPRTPLPQMQFLDLKAQFETIRAEVFEAVATVLESQQFILGEQVQLLEKELATFLNVPHAVGCASGSDALYLALSALEIGAGDEVITTPFTFVATAGAIARTGAKPVFVDIERATFNIDPVLIPAVITKKTRAIIPVHLFGLPANLSPILAIAQAHGMAVIEDTAQAIGATYGGHPVGGLGDFGCFSFFPSKNLGCAGDGGLITTRDADQARRLRLLRAHGSARKYQYEILGVNSRLDALQAAILRVKLKHLKKWEQQRQEHASIYCKLFDDYKLAGIVTLPSATPESTHVYNQFVIRCADRERLRTYLHERGVPTDVYYPSPLHLQPAFAYAGYQQGAFPEAEAACEQALALPIYPELKPAEQECVVRTISDFYFPRS
jgi:dTDP-4-amino-4,6-dideoxygalactose transaminase